MNGLMETSNQQVRPGVSGRAAGLGLHGALIRLQNYARHGPEGHVPVQVQQDADRLTLVQPGSGHSETFTLRDGAYQGRGGLFDAAEPMDLRMLLLTVQDQVPVGAEPPRSPLGPLAQRLSEHGFHLWCSRRSVRHTPPEGSGNGPSRHRLLHARHPDGRLLWLQLFTVQSPEPGLPHSEQLIANSQTVALHSAFSWGQFPSGWPLQAETLRALLHDPCTCPLPGAVPEDYWTRVDDFALQENPRT